MSKRTTARAFFAVGGIIPLSEQVAGATAEVFRQLGSPRRRATDIVIGVTAAFRNATSLTRNASDFAGMPGLHVDTIGGPDPGRPQNRTPGHLMRLVVDAGMEARVVAQGVDFAGPAIPAGFHDSDVLSCRVGDSRRFPRERMKPPDPSARLRSSAPHAPYDDALHSPHDRSHVLCRRSCRRQLVLQLRRG